ncbi:MAG: hypothetical protein AAF502_19820 [Bacteroidota bacterium]
MNKNIIIGIAALAVIALLFVFLNQKKAIQAKKDKIETQQDSIYSLDRALALEKQATRDALAENERLSVENEQLEEAKAELDKEVQRLKKEIKDLKLRIKTQRGTIEGIRAEIAEKENAIADLTNRQKSEKQELEAQIFSLQLTTDSILVSKDSLVNQMLDKQEEEEFYQTSLQIIEKTVVAYQLVSPRKDKNDKEIKRLKKNNWNYTYIEFSMYHESPELLADQNFILKIVDADSKRPLPMRETNPEFPDSDMNELGLSFTFTDNPITMMHVNMEEKPGDSYKMALYYVNEGEEFPLQNGTIDIMRNGKPEPIGF